MPTCAAFIHLGLECHTEVPESHALCPVHKDLYWQKATFKKSTRSISDIQTYIKTVIIPHIQAEKSGDQTLLKTATEVLLPATPIAPLPLPYRDD